MPQQKSGTGNDYEVKLRAQFEFTSTEFVDYGHEYRDDHEYDRMGKDQGMVLIFKQEKFDDTSLELRQGCARDVNNVISTFTKLGFNVKQQNVHSDLDRKQIFEEIAKLNPEECKNKNSLIVIFMSHGNRGNILYTRSGQIGVHELIEWLAEYFQGKPKLFIIQACKATLNNIQEECETQLTFPIYTLPLDTLVYYSTVEGKVSVRHPIRGSWVIEELCRNFLMYGRKEDVVSLLQRTTKCVSILETMVDEERRLTIKQMPVMVSTLQKKFYLTSNRFRKNIHVVTKGIGEVSADLKKLYQQISTNDQ